MRAIYWFKRDLRVHDNRGFTFAAEHFDEVVPVFVFDADLLDRLGAFDGRLEFIRGCVSELAREIPVQTFHGHTTRVFERLIAFYRPDAIVTQESLTWSGSARDAGVERVAERAGVRFVRVFDGFLADPRRLPFRRVFSAFYRQWLDALDLAVAPAREPRHVVEDRPGIEAEPPPTGVRSPLPPDWWRQRVEEFSFADYARRLDRLDEDGTSRLSPFLRFGCLSVRELFLRAAQWSESFVRELAWREFFYHVAHYAPHVRDREFQDRMVGFPWSGREEWWDAFARGETGYPIVDAALRQLAREHWLSNRARMIVASFLTKDLLIDWRRGERHFARCLLDYDEVVNTGNWQWVAGVGADPRPFRVFNPSLQARALDPDCRYIRAHLPEYRGVPCRELQRGVRPIVDHAERAREARRLWLAWRA